VLRFMINLPSRGVVANAAIPSGGADLKKMSATTRDAQRDEGSGYEPEELLARSRKVQPGFPCATLETKEGYAWRVTCNHFLNSSRRSVHSTGESKSKNKIPHRGTHGC
jgi:hypothetical protein